MPFEREGAFDYALGAELVGRAADRSAFYAHELYASLRAGPVELTVGRQEETFGFADRALSLGSTTWSRHATPMPKVALAVPDYTSVPGTDGFVAARGYIAHGWFESDRVVENAYLHQKNLYLRALPERWPVQAHAGFQHNVMWGGTGRASDLEAFWSIFRAETFGDGEREGIGRGGSLGNMVVSYDFAVTAQAFGLSLRAYWQYHFEEKGSELFRSMFDGLYGVALRSDRSDRLVSGLVYEHLRTLRQNAKTDPDPDRSSIVGTWGRSDFHNHNFYDSGWTYHGRTIGIPLLVTDVDAPNIAADISGRPIANNRVIGHHLGLEGQLPLKIRYRVFLTYSRNFGTVRNELDDLRQFSGALELQRALWRQYGIEGVAQVSVDRGAVFEDQVGLMMGISWSGAL